MSKTLIISHAHSIGGQFADHRLWMGVIEGETDVWDYHTKENLKKEAEKEGMKWKVLRQHRDGTTSVIEQSQKDKNE